MLDRRGVLAILGKSMVAGAGLKLGLARSPFVRASAESAPAVLPATASTFDTELQADMDRLATRVYSEEGIPMILACEDLTAHTPVVPASRTMNDTVAPAYQHCWEAWHRMHPEAPVGDVARLVELLSYRDFAGDGKDTHL